MEEKISREVAELEFNRFTDAMDIDVDTSKMDEEDTKGLNQLRDRVVGAIMNGSLTINDDGEPTFSPRRSRNTDPITFYEPTGATLMAMDRKKKSEDMGKLYVAMADMTKTTPATFSSMAMADLKVCIAVVTLFLA